MAEKKCAVASPPSLSRQNHDSPKPAGISSRSGRSTSLVNDTTSPRDERARNLRERYSSCSYNSGPAHAPGTTEQLGIEDVENGRTGWGWTRSMSAACYRPLWPLISTRRSGARRFWWGACAGGFHHPGPRAGAVRRRRQGCESAAVSQPGRSSSATNGGTGSTSSSVANSTGVTVSSITELVPNLFATPLTTTAPPDASAPPTAQPVVIPFGPSSAPATARSFGQLLLVNQEQALQSAHLGQEDDLGDSEASGSAVADKKQAERFIKIIEKPKATAPTKAPEQRPEPAPAPKLVPIFSDERRESVLDIVDYGFLTTLFEAGSSQPESAPNEPVSWPGLWAMLGASALSTGALLLAIPVPNLSLWRRVETIISAILPGRSGRAARQLISLATGDLRHRIRHYGPATHQEHRP